MCMGCGPVHEIADDEIDEIKKTHRWTSILSQELWNHVCRLTIESQKARADGDHENARLLDQLARKNLAACDDAMAAMFEAEMLLQSAGFEFDPPYSLQDD